MNTPKTDVEILPIEPVELERTPARAGETLIHRFRTFFLGVLLSGCAAAPGSEKPVEPVKTPEIVPEKKSASSTEPHRWDAIIGVDLAGEEQKPSEKPVFMTMAFHEISPLNASLLTPSFEPASVGTGNAVMASFPKAEIDQALLPEPLPIDL